jgi:hypothetical protein
VTASDFVFTLKTTQQPYKKIQSQETRKFCRTQSFDSSDMMYLLMPDRFANGNNNNDSENNTKEKHNRELPGGRLAILKEL